MRNSIRNGRKIAIFEFAVCVAFLQILVSTCRYIVQAQTSTTTPSLYDLNHYQILGLLPEDYYFNNTSTKVRQDRDKKPNPSDWSIPSRRTRISERKEFTDRDVKKAYRKQAQAWHPDKVAHRKRQQSMTKNQSSTSSTSSQNDYNPMEYDNLEIDACNLRFAKIGEAYEVLSNREKRDNYDLFLLDMEDKLEKNHHEKARSKTQRNNSFRDNDDFDFTIHTATSRFNDAFSESLHLFEEFFFGASTDKGEHINDFFDGIFGSQRKDHQQPRKDSTHDHTGRHYYTYEDHHHHRYSQSNKSSYRSHYNHRSQRRRPMVVPSHKMQNNEYITPKTVYLYSENRKFYAGLTLECELVIMHDQGPGFDDIVIWGSDTFLPEHYRHSCSLAMYGPQVAIVVGDVENPTSVLWNSPQPLPIVQNTPDDMEEPVDFYCSLDDDGSIAIYRTREDVDISSLIGNDLLPLASSWLIDFFQEDTLTPPNQDLATSWRSIKQWALLKVHGKAKHWSKMQEYDPRTGTLEVIELIDECVFATGPAGCMRPGRFVINISTNIRRSIKYAIIQIEDKIENFIDAIYEGAEDDIDIFDTGLRIITGIIRSVEFLLRDFLTDMFYFTERLIYISNKWRIILQDEALDYSLKLRKKINALMMP